MKPTCKYFLRIVKIIKINGIDGLGFSFTVPGWVFSAHAELYSQQQAASSQYLYIWKKTKKM